MVSDFLNKPYPIVLNKWRIIYFVSAFIFLFLFIFQPFGITAIQDSLKNLILFGYSLITALMLVFCLFILPLIFKKWFDEENWTIKTHLIWMLIIITCIGTGNFIYSALALNLNFTFRTFLIFQLVTISIGIIPVSAISIIKFNSLLKLNLKTALEVNNSLTKTYPSKIDSKKISIICDNKKDKISIHPDELLFIQSIGNYIQITRKKEGEIIKSTVRCSLKSIEAQLGDFSYIYRCHRTFMVNLNKIESLSGNAQGLKIKLKQYSATLIPVSRSLTKDLKSKLNSNQ